MTRTGRASYNKSDPYNTRESRKFKSYGFFFFWLSRAQIPRKYDAHDDHRVRNSTPSVTNGNSSSVTVLTPEPSILHGSTARQSRTACKRTITLGRKAKRLRVTSREKKNFNYPYKTNVAVNTYFDGSVVQESVKTTDGGTWHQAMPESVNAKAMCICSTRESI